ncbi:MAG: histone deacetylase family protein [Myxococcaceae bacterium]
MTVRTSVFHDPLFLQHNPGEHNPGAGHPERPERLAAIWDLLQRAPVQGVEHRRARPATRAELVRVHHTELITTLEGLRGKSARLDEDTLTSSASIDAAWLAAGASVEATQDVLAGRTANAFAMVRPPGHHAEADRAMGFCLLNNAAIAAEAALHSGLARVAVLDWDVHHGNGTQHSFFSRRDVMYLSSHQFPFYPGTGAPGEIGAGAGEGYTVNVALPGEQNDADHGAVFSEIFVPVLQSYRPELLIISAGFDSHHDDPLGGMKVTERGFAAMCSAMKQLAEEVCGGKLVLLLEGGYSLEGLSQSVHACLEVMTGRRESFPTGASATTTAAISATRDALRPFWPTLA